MNLRRMLVSPLVAMLLMLAGIARASDVYGDP